MKRATRRLLILVALALAGLTLAAAPAEATFHLNKVNEVMLASASGDAHVQFVELFDSGGPTETYPPAFAPYKLVIYDGAGSKVGEHTLSASGLSGARAAGRPYLVSTSAADAALGVSGDEALDVSLPPAAGQACYTSGAQETAYSCITWGCISRAVSASAGTGSAQGPVPPNGESAQRQPDGSIEIAAPTPKAANRMGTSAPGCPATDGGRAFTGVTLANHKVELRPKGRAVIALSCPAGSGGCSGRLKLLASGASKNGSRARQVVIATASFRLAAGATQKVKLSFTRAGKSQLARKRRLHARAAIVATDGSGTSKDTMGMVLIVHSRR